MAPELVTVFNNSDFVILDKPAGSLSVPARFADDPRDCIGLRLQTQLKQQVYPTHRLDFEVSGILIFALNAKAHAATNSWFEQKTVQKIYQALSTGSAPGQTLFEWKANILRGKKRAYESPAGKPSHTRAEFLGVQDHFLRWKLMPVTGRSHQLRFDLSRHGFPIVGDELYGSKVQHQANAIALRAVEIIFPPQATAFGLPPQLKVQGLF